MRRLAAMAAVAVLAGCSDTDRPQPPWTDVPAPVVVSAEQVALVCPVVGSRIACYRGGTIYLQPHEPYLPEDEWELTIPPDWVPPPWPAPSPGWEQEQARESGRALLLHNGFKEEDVAKIFNRAEHLAHEAARHAGFR